METGEISQQLGEWTALTEDLNWVPRAHINTLNCLELQFKEDPVPLACAGTHIHVCITSHSHRRACLIKNKYF